MAAPIKVPIIGYRFGKLLVLKASGRKYAKHKAYECLCDCGRRVIVQAAHLRTGETTSCGCERGHNGTTAKTRPAVPAPAAGRRGTDRIGSRRN